MVIAHTLVHVSKISRFSEKVFLRLVKIQTGNNRFVVCAEDSIVLNLFFFQLGSDRFITNQVCVASRKVVSRPN